MTRELSIPLNPSGSPAGQETASYSSIDVETFTIPANEELSNSVELLPEVGPASGSRKRTIVSLEKIGIKPAEGMVGVVGDMIPSNQVVNPELHFVSPKKTVEIPNDYVVFEVTGIGEDRIKDGDEDQVVTWVGGEAVPDVPLQRRVKRDQAAKTELKITTLPQHGSEQVAKVNIWVVWATANVASLQDVMFTRDAAGANYQGSALLQKQWRFVYKIFPEAIVADEGDRPDLSGDKRSPLPGEQKPHFFVAGRNADSATLKWDVSRKLEIVVYNGDLIPKNKFPGQYIYRNQPLERDAALPFPADAVEGNDDPGGAGWLDEEVNPYNDFQGVGAGAGLDHAKGEISSRDGPVFRFENATGQAGATLAQVANFKEFARLEILSETGTPDEPAWFRISDYTAWHHVMAGTFGEDPHSHQNIWENAGSQSGQGVFETP